jgi:hypothetical protein
LKELNLPEYSFKITGEPGNEMIFDRVRRKYVRLTPEEWVRQNFVQYLIQKGNYPSGLMIIEAAIKLFKTKKRVDILIHDRTARPVMMVECKADDVELDENVIEQIATYNMQFKVPYLIVTNGMVNIAVKFNDDYSAWEQRDMIPMFEEL